MKRILAQGFTLVELLIVIALLGIIATIVIAAINPIEQAARANDAGMKADASQLLSATQRFYVSQSKYPWNVCDGAGCTPPVANVSDPVPFVSADTAGYGLCTVTGKSCKTQAVQGSLVTSLELQTAFLNKSWIGATNGGAIDYSSGLFIGKGGTASSAVYVCWVPKSTSDKQKLVSAGKAIDITKSFQGSSDSPTVNAACDASKTAGWTDGTCSECVPE